MTKRTHGLAQRIAEAMADHANKDRYVLENGWQSTGVEPYEHDADDFADLAEIAAAISLDDSSAVNVIAELRGEIGQLRTALQAAYDWLMIEDDPYLDEKGREQVAEIARLLRQ